jgi:hypothetical protein
LSTFCKVLDILEGGIKGFAGIPLCQKFVKPLDKSEKLAIGIAGIRSDGALWGALEKPDLSSDRMI